jgi:hypothetical protein
MRPWTIRITAAGTKPRAALASYLARVRGVRADPVRIVITQGFTQGLALICQVLPTPGREPYGAGVPRCLGSRAARSKGARREPYASRRPCPA